jgi:hypothetical protein
MQRRRIVLKTKFDHLGRILKDLEIIETKVQFNSADNTFELCIEKEETADLFKKLSTDPGIVSWEFDEGIEPLQNTETTKLEPQQEKNKSNLIPYFTNYNDAATFIEGVWRLSKKSPNMIFGSQLFKKEAMTEFNVVGSSQITVEHSLLTMILQNYYKDLEFTEAYEDIVEKLKQNWKALSGHPGLASLAKLWT